MTRQDAADRLGLSLQGLFHQMRADRPVSRQTELLLEALEREYGEGDPQTRGGSVNDICRVLVDLHARHPEMDADLF